MTGSIDQPAATGVRAEVELTRGDLGFAAAHFSMVGGVSERLHGHNYRVSLRAYGEIGRDGSVVDFRLLKEAVRAECRELDEHMLVPTAGGLTIDVRDDDVEVCDANRRFVFPHSDVVLLPIADTTCECLAAYLLGRLRARLGTLSVRLDVGVEEMPGQGARVSE